MGHSLWGTQGSMMMTARFLILSTTTPRVDVGCSSMRYKTTIILLRKNAKNWGNYHDQQLQLVSRNCTERRRNLTPFLKKYDMRAFNYKTYLMHNF